MSTPCDLLGCGGQGSSVPHRLSCSEASTGQLPGLGCSRGGTLLQALFALAKAGLPWLWIHSGARHLCARSPWLGVFQRRLNHPPAELTDGLAIPLGLAILGPV